MSPGIDEQVAAHVQDVAMAAKRQRPIEFVVQDLQTPGHTRLTHRAEPVEERAPDHGRTRARCDSLEDVLARLPALLYAHGGGWVFGNLDSHDVLCAQLAIEAGIALTGEA